MNSAAKMKFAGNQKKCQMVIWTHGFQGKTNGQTSHE
jgi:hypothetical protein